MSIFEKAFGPSMDIQNFINGAFVAPVNKLKFDNINPATASVICTVPDSDEMDVEMAIDAATAAFPSWQKTSNEERFRILHAISTGIMDNLEKFAMAESLDTGKPLSLAKTVDIPRSAQNFEFFATAIMHFASESHEMQDVAINYTLRKPLGVVACISPWNLPLYLFSWKIAPALAAGNCVVAKPSEVTPLTAYLLGEICQKAGLPNGVLNILHGFGHKVGAALIAHPKIKAISFTGGTSTGKTIASIAAPQFKKLSLELGGKNPNIIFADAEWDKAMETTLLSSFRNQGQICLCGSRILIESSIYEKFKTEFVAKVANLKVGNPMDGTTNVGAVVSKNHYHKILDCIELAKSEGGKILIGGQPLKMDGDCEQGYFIAPTVIEGLPQNCKTNTEEIFGPVVTLQPFENEAEAISIANGTNYGLSATVWTSDLKKAHRMANNLEAGIVWINTWMLRDLRTPFGGVKQSGVGREGGWEAMRFFTDAKNVVIKY